MKTQDQNEKVNKTKTAHIYGRFSTIEQQDGDSERRQLDKAKRYIAEQGWHLGETVVDRGVSGYHGKNHERGALGQLLQRATQGEVVVVEDRDRWSRERVWKSQERLEQAVERGIEIVFLNTRSHVTRENLDDDNNVLTGLLTSFVANRESKKKSERIAETWEVKRQAVLAGKPARINRLPCWLHWNEETGKADVIESRAAVVRQMFDLAAQGHQILEIVRMMMKAKTPAITASKKPHGKKWRVAPCWNPVTVRRILTDKATLGYCTSFGGEPIPNVWPPIIDESTFAVAQSKLDIQPTDKRPAHKSERNLLTGIARCACGQHNLILHWSGGAKSNGAHNDSRLVCQGAGAGRSKCGFAGAPYALLEKSLLSLLANGDLLRPLLASKEQKPSRLEELQARLAEAEKQAAKLSRLICDDPEPSQMIYGRLKQEESRAKSLRGEVEDEQMRARGEQPALAGYNEFVEQLPALAADPARRADLRRAVRAVVESVTLDPRGENVARGRGSLLLLTKHKAEARRAYTVDLILRDLPEQPSFVAQWQFPLFERAEDLHPEDLKQAGGRKQEHTAKGLLALLNGGMTNAQWLTAAAQQGMSRATFYRLRREAVAAGAVEESEGAWTKV